MASCNVPGCRTRARPGLLMCGKHRRLVPDHLTGGIETTSYHGISQPSDFDQLTAAVDAVCDEIGEPTIGGAARRAP